MAPQFFNRLCQTPTGTLDRLKDTGIGYQSLFAREKGRDCTILHPPSQRMLTDVIPFRHQTFMYGSDTSDFTFVHCDLQLLIRNFCTILFLSNEFVGNAVGTDSTALLVFFPEVFFDIFPGT